MVGVKEEKDFNLSRRLPRRGISPFYIHSYASVAILAPRAPYALSLDAEALASAMRAAFLGPWAPRLLWLEAQGPHPLWS